MSDAFPHALDHVLRHEGGYVDDPRDPGGATNMGITIATLAAWRGRAVTKAEVAALGKDEAAAIYRRNYWDAAKCGKLPPALGFMVFDCAVNQGVRAASRFLQLAVGAEPDGAIGPKTLAAVDAADPRKALTEFAARRMHHYGQLGTFDRFGLGWSRRLMATLAAALAL